MPAAVARRYTVTEVGETDGVIQGIELVELRLDRDLTIGEIDGLAFLVNQDLNILSVK